MTGTSSSRGRLFSNFDSYKNQEWLRRRKLRIEQVRQQSSEIAKALRQKVENEEKLRNLALAKVEELKFKIWRAEKLDEMERKLRFALEEFGLGHRLIESEPDPKEILETKNELNKWKAQERGEIAVQKELKKKKIEKNKKMSPIERKKMTRKLEDLRSALVCSLRTHKQFPKFGEESEILDPITDSEIFERKTIIKKKRVKPNQNQNPPTVNVKEVTLKKKGLENSLSENSQVYQEKSNKQTAEVKSKLLQNNIWDDINNAQNASGANLNKSIESKTSLSIINSSSGRTDKSVEFYDYNSRYHCKTFRDYPDVVERVETFNMPQKLELNKEAKMNQINERKKEEADILCRERGDKALKKERINREYNDLITKLNDLHKREKIIKTMQHIPSDIIYMTDDRISEKARNKQRVMNAKFESLYYEAIAHNNDLNAAAQFPSNIPWESEVDSDERVSTKVSLSPTHLKRNSPATSSGNLQKNSTSPKVGVTRPKKKRKKSKQKLVDHIDKTLKEGRKLRESVASRKQDKSPQNTSQLEDSGNETVKVKPKLNSPVTKKAGKKSKTFKNQISQTEDFEKSFCFCSDAEEKKNFSDQMGNDSILVSSATSYKSPPCEIRSCKLTEFLRLSDLLSKIEGHQNCVDLKRKVEDALFDLLHEMQSTRSEDQCSSFGHLRNPTLKDYILKLLGMSRERVANLSVSAGSTPTYDFERDLQPENEIEGIKSESESACSCVSHVESRKLEDQVELEDLNESTQNWKSVVGEASKSNEDAYIPKPEDEECGPEFVGDYNEITKRCEERIEELSNLLKKVREEKEKLLKLPPESSNKNNLNCTPNLENSFDGLLPEEDDLTDNESVSSESKTVSSDSQSTLDTFPDVLEELLDKKILTSPFKWYKKIYSNQPASPELASIEAITHNFRQQMSRIKPCVFDTPGHLPTIYSSIEEITTLE